jgi:ATP-dependent helicase/nuclease subunit A
MPPPRHLPQQLMAAPAFTGEQTRAIERRDGELLLDAGAGSGKTAVLVERFVRSVLEDGIEVGAILAITFTEKAAGELRQRIRGRLLELGAFEQARASERAQISTIHGFCARVLRAHALAAGLDPAFAVLDEPAAGRLAALAFEEALEALAEERTGALELIAAHGFATLRAAILSVHDELRSRGVRRPRLPALAAAPEEAPARAQLRRAAAGLAAELGAIAEPGRRVAQALQRIERCLALAEADEPAAAQLDALALPGGNGAALKTPACEEYARALAALRAVCEHRQAARAHALLDELLERFGARYAERKREVAGVDFQDLELLARELLRDEALCERYRARFQRVMVDEMQDTNAVQLELIERLAAGRLFTVGDAQQSIYGFRHADVELFRRRGERLAALGRRETLETNFRSRPELLGAINAAFAAAIGEGFRPLRPGREGGAAPSPEPVVELLIADKGADWAGEDALAAPWRLAEARALAQRVGELIGSGAVRAGDVVVLSRAGSDLRVYERALEECGVPTYTIGGRGYWRHPQVIDLLAYLQALANPREEQALYTVLCSPLVGASHDALVLLGAAARARRADVWQVLREPGEALAGLAGDERAALCEFAAWFAAERDLAVRLGVPELLERALQRTGYDLAVLAMAGGERRLANVRKLMRLAAEHESHEGRDLAGFLELARRRAAGEPGGARESEAPVEGEALDAVRLMTIHRSKGLEFPVVCVADLGRAPIRPAPLLRVGADGRFGIRLSQPGSGRADPALAYAALGDEQRRREEAEERRLFYVAATRARDRLILSGAARLDALAAGGAPISWLAPAFVPELASLASERRGVSAGGVAYRFVRPGEPACTAPAAAAGPVAAAAGPVAAAAGPVAAAASAAVLAPAPASAGSPAEPPAAARVPTLSYSALADYRRCGYRFYAERVLGLPPRAAARGGGGTGGLDAAARGTLIHALLERLDFRRPAPPTVAAVQELAPELGEEGASELAALVGAFAASELCARLARAPELAREQRFTLSLGRDRPLVIGAFDVIARERGGRMLIVDYKSDRLGGRDPHELLAAAYAEQRLIYALAALRAGAREVEVAHVFLEAATRPLIASFTPADAGALDRRLRELVAPILAGRFPVAEEPHRALCAGCPAEAGLCSHPPALTRRESPGRLF